MTTSLASPALNIESLTRVQKLQLIESLWASLTQDEGSIPTPEWHLRELDRRRAIPEENIGEPWSVVRAEITARP